MNLKFKGLKIGNLIITTERQLVESEVTYTDKEIFELVDMLIGEMKNEKNIL